MKLTYPLVLIMCIVKFSIAVKLSYNIDEEGGENMRIGNILQDSGSKLKVPADLKSSLTFKLIRKGFDFASYFSVTPHSAELRTRDNIDRETICGRKNCAIELLVAVRSSLETTYFQSIQITVLINDVNDNAPSFLQRTSVLSIPESASIGTRYRLPSAIDNDLGKNTVKKYEIGGSSRRTFGVVGIENLDRSATVYLIVRERLDREYKSTYKVILIATDGGVPSLSGRLFININVTDINDNAPKFDKNIYTANFDENIPVKTVLLQVEATDLDQGINGRLYYYIGRQTNSDYKDQFDVDESSGKITLKKPLDYEKHTEYRFIVEAVDGGSQAHTSQVIVAITVNDINDEVPVIHDSLLQPIPESAAVDHFVVLITVSDADSGQNGQVDCGIDNNSFKLVRSQDEERQFRLLLNTTLDYEKTKLFEVNLSCKDRGTPQKSAKKTLRLTVEDVNDNYPLFNLSLYTSYVLENCPINTRVLKVAALDNDSGNNSKISYRLSDDAFPHFSVDKTSGVISTNSEIDREIKSLHRFTVIARDNGQPRRQSSSQVVLTVVDENDQRPSFSKTSYQFDFPENDNVNVVVGTVSAVDGDVGNNSIVFYSIVHPSVPFRIDRKLGVIYSHKIYDRETMAKYRFRVSASDCGLPRLISTVIVTVHITDLNDNTPFISTPENVTLRLPFTASIGSMLFNVLAYDADYGENGKLNYRIVGGNGAKFVEINTKGWVSSIKKMAATDKGKYSITVEVTDSAEFPLKARSSFIFLVTDSENETNYLIIIIIIIVSTFLLACLIIVVIFILIRLRNKRNQRAATLAGSQSNGSVVRDGGEIQMMDYYSTFNRKNGDIYKSRDFTNLDHNPKSQYSQMISQGSSVHTFPRINDDHNKQISRNKGSSGTGVLVSNSNRFYDHHNNDLPEFVCKRALEKNSDLSSESSRDSGRGSSEDVTVKSGTIHYINRSQSTQNKRNNDHFKSKLSNVALYTDYGNGRKKRFGKERVGRVKSTSSCSNNRQLRSFLSNGQYRVGHVAQTTLTQQYPHDISWPSSTKKSTQNPQKTISALNDKARSWAHSDLQKQSRSSMSKQHDLDLLVGRTNFRLKNFDSNVCIV